MWITRFRKKVKPLIVVLSGVILPVVIAACGSDDSSDGADSSNEPITIGLATAKSGFIALYDEGPDQAVKLRAELINKSGGVEGRQIEVIDGNTQSDKALSTNVANELIQDGADVLLVTCDFDYASPAAIAANQQEIPAISGCGADPKLGDTTTLGPFVYTAAAASDVEGTVGAEWAIEAKDWTKAFVLQDEGLEYSKSVGRYFRTRYEELDGQIVGEETFPGGDNVDVRSQVTAMGPDANGADFIYLASYNPGAATAIRQIRQGGVDLPIVSDAAIDGSLLSEIAGNVSDVFLTAYGCFDFCKGGPDKAQYEWADEMAAKFGSPPAQGSTITGDTVVRVIAAAVEESGSLDGPTLMETIDSMGPVETLAGDVVFATPRCHHPATWPLYVQEIRNGENQFVDKRSAEKIPDLGEGNGCAGEAEPAPEG